MAEVVGEAAVDGRALYAKISWRLIPYMFLLYIVAYLDRVNVGFAAMDMQRDLHFSNTVYGTGAGIFFLGIGAVRSAEQPDSDAGGGAGVDCAHHDLVGRDLDVHDVHAVRQESFYVLRFLLGVSEAGFFPGMILYLTYWFPTHERARAVARVYDGDFAGGSGGWAAVELRC